MQIKDAQWVSHVVNTTFPHVSPSKFFPIYSKFFERNKLGYPSSFLNLGIRLESMPYLKQKPNAGFLRKFFDYLNFYKYEKKISFKNFKILRSIFRQISKITDLRDTYSTHDAPKKGFVLKLTDAVSKKRVANCMESAVLAEGVLKLNGVKNARAVSLFNGSIKTEHQIDHAFCIIPPDGKAPKAGQLHPKTLVIDPWSGKCDYAANIIADYRNTMTKHFYFRKINDIYYKPLEDATFSKREIKELRKAYPQLVYPNKSHKFMSTK